MVNIPGYQEDKHDNLPQRKLGPGWKKKEKKKSEIHILLNDDQRLKE